MLNSSFITLDLALNYLNQKIKPMKKLLSILSICLVFISCTSTPEEKIAYATKEELSAAPGLPPFALTPISSGINRNI